MYFEILHYATKRNIYYDIKVHPILKCEIEMFIIFELSYLMSGFKNFDFCLQLIKISDTTWYPYRWLCFFKYIIHFCSCEFKACMYLYTAKGHVQCNSIQFYYTHVANPYENKQWDVLSLICALGDTYTCSIH